MSSRIYIEMLYEGWIVCKVDEGLTGKEFACVERQDVIIAVNKLLDDQQVIARAAQNEQETTK